MNRHIAIVKHLCKELRRETGNRSSRRFLLSLVGQKASVSKPRCKVLYLLDGMLIKFYKRKVVLKKERANLGSRL